jgi:hypothetical protein
MFDPDDGDFTDNYTARDLEGDGNTTPDFRLLADQFGFQTQPLKTPVNRPIQVLLPVTTTTDAAPPKTRPPDDPAIGTAVPDGAPPLAAPPTDDPSLPLPETGYRQGGNVYVRDEAGNAVQVFPIGGQWQTRGGVLARYITAYASARRQGQSTTDATRTAAASAGYYVPSVDELTRALAVGTGTASYAGPGATAALTAAAISPQLDRIGSALAYREISDQATAEHRRIMARDAFRREIRTSIAEILTTVHGIAAALPPAPRRF